MRRGIVLFAIRQCVSFHDDVEVRFVCGCTFTRNTEDGFEFVVVIDVHVSADVLLVVSRDMCM